MLFFLRPHVVFGSGASGYKRLKVIPKPTKIHPKKRSKIHPKTFQNPP